MAAELYALRSTPAETFVLYHLAPLALPGKPWQEQMAAKRWATGMPTPYRWVNDLGGPGDEFSGYPTVRLHTIAATYADAASAARAGHDRMMLLVTDPGYPVMLPNGRVADLEEAECTDLPHEEPYAAESVATRFVSEYKLALSFFAA